MNITNEQQTIIQSAIAGEDIAIRAFAGTGKSSTLRLIAQAVPKTTLCLAFNKSIADEMQQAMLSDGSAWVTCQTINSLAWRAVVKSSNSKFGKKLEAGLSLNDIKKYVHDFKELPSEERVEALINVKERMTKFLNSAHPTPEYYTDGIILLKYWNFLKDENHPAGISHDVYVKLYQLSKQKLNFDVLMADEWQDFNECNLDIIYNQKQYGTQLIVVGDTNQEIFGFRSSVTAFKTLPSYFKDLRLSESFRFTPEIAEVCTKLVKINGEDVPVVGRNSYRSSEQVAYICRTNLTVFQLAFSLLSSRKKVHLIADLKPLSNQLYHIADLMCGKQPKFPNKELSQYAVKEDLYVAAKKQQELATLINLTKLLMDNGGVWRCLEKLKKETVPLADAEVVIATCHKLKGLGFDSVVVMEDFLYLREDEDLSLVPSKLVDGQTLELLYVAISRAKYSVELPDLVQYVIDNADNIRPNYLEMK